MIEMSSANPTLAPPELETLIQEIQRIPPAQWNNLLGLLQVFRQAVANPPQSNINQAAIDLLRSWREDEGDEQEQRETWEFLKTALDEDRLSDRPLFPS
jgi:hypothetical protein